MVSVKASGLAGKSSVSVVSVSGSEVGLLLVFDAESLESPRQPAIKVVHKNILNYIENSRIEWVIDRLDQDII